MAQPNAPGAPFTHAPPPLAPTPPKRTPGPRPRLNTLYQQSYFATMESLFTAVQHAAFAQGFSVRRGRTSREHRAGHSYNQEAQFNRVEIWCHCAGSSTATIRKSYAMKTNCPFKAVGSLHKSRENSWLLRVVDGTHNHPPNPNLVDDEQFRRWFRMRLGGAYELEALVSIARMAAVVPPEQQTAPPALLPPPPSPPAAAAAAPTEPPQLGNEGGGDAEAAALGLPPGQRPLPQLPPAAGTYTLPPQQMQQPPLLQTFADRRADALKALRERMAGDQDEDVDDESEEDSELDAEVVKE